MHNTSFNVKKTYFTDSQLISIDLCCLTFKCDNLNFSFSFQGTNDTNDFPATSKINSDNIDQFQVSTERKVLFN